jgi:hypothetical protein
MFWILQNLAMGGSSAQGGANYTAPNVTASGTTFAQFQAGGASGHLERLIAAQSASSNPTTAATWSATGGGSAGGLLAAGTYYGVITETNGFGETLASNQQTQITVSAGNVPQITFQTLQSGNTARNVYLGAVNGLTGGPYYLYATGITTGTYNLAAAVPVNSFAVGPPAENSTGLTYVTAAGPTDNTALVLLRSVKDGNVEDLYRYLARLVIGFNQGDPATFATVITRFRRAHAAIAVLNTLCSEMGTLIDVNAGTLGMTTDPIGNTKTRRTWP